MSSEFELTSRLRWLINIRWIAIALLLIGGLFLSRFGHVGFSRELYLILGFVALYNSYFTLRLKQGSTFGYERAVWQILLDQFSLAAAVYYSGSCESPFIYFFILHVITSGILLPARYAAVFTAISILLPLGVMALTHSGILPYHAILEDAFRLNLNSIMNYGAVYSATLVVAFYLTTYLSGQIRKNKHFLAQSNKRLASFLSIVEGGLDEDILSVELSNLLDYKVQAKIIFLSEVEHKKCYKFRNCSNKDCIARSSVSNCFATWGNACFRKSDNREENLKQCSECSFMLHILREFLEPYGGNLRDDDISDSLKTGIGILFGLGVSIPKANFITIPLINEKGELMAVLCIISEKEISLDSYKSGILSAVSQKLALELVKEKVFSEFEYSYEATILALTNALEARDPYTKGHSERVANLAVQIANELGLGRQWKEHLRIAALLHDIGKVGTKSTILFKNSSLSENEAEEMRIHMELGVQILEPVPFLRPILPSIRHHHERYDGKGYPLGISGSDIPLGARILAAADAWDAMLSDRPYRKALSLNDAKEEILKTAGTQFDPDVAEALLRVVDRLYNGSDCATNPTNNSPFPRPAGP